MPFKDQTESYRKGGWLCWCDGYGIERAAEIVADVRRQGFKAKREGDRVFVQKADMGRIDATDHGSVKGQP